MQMLWNRYLLLLVVCYVTKGLAQETPQSLQDSTEHPTIYLPGQLYTSGEQVWSVSIADMNQDQHPDIVAASKVDGLITVHINDGKGVFSKKNSTKVSENNRAVCAFDANGDGYPDVGVVTLTGQLSILFNDQKGGLQRKQALQVSVMAHDLTAADLDGDKDIDLVALGVNDRSLRIFTNDGKGHFQLSSTLTTGASPRVVKVGDLNGDGLVDLVAGGDVGKLYIHRQKKDGQFASYTSLRSTSASWGLGLGDLDKDGSLDIVAASYHERQLFIHLNRGDGTFIREQELLSGDHNFDVVLCDVDLDGDLDIATCSTVDKALSIHLNDGRGIIGPRQEIKSGDWNAGIDAADLDQDGDIDLVVGSINDQGIIIHRNIAGDKAAVARKLPCIRGTIYEAETKKVIAKAQVSLQDAKERPVDAAMTKEDGTFTFCPVPNKTYTLIVRTEKYPVYREEIEMPVHDIEKEIYLALPSATMMIARVSNKETEQVISGAWVKLIQDDTVELAKLITNTKGRCEKELPFGTNYQAIASAEGFDTVKVPFSVLQTDYPKGKRVNLRLSQIKDPTAACLSGVVRHIETKEPIAEAVLEVRSIETGRYKRVKADEEGQYKACLPFGNYEITTTKLGFFFDVSTVGIEKKDVVQGKEKDIFLKPLEVGESIVLENIYFDVDKAVLREESMLELDRIIKIMQDNPNLVVEIAGHTDSDATDAYNLTLSQNRAQAVVDYLLASGVLAPRLEALGYGESQPVVPNDSPENKQLNRRTEFSVKSFGYSGLEK